MLRRLRNQLATEHLARTLGLLTTAVVLGLGLALVGCSADSPSAPAKDPGDPPGQTPANATYDITVTLTPGEIPVGSDEPVQVEVRVQRRDNNQPPPTGTTMVVSASAGSFGSPEGPNRVAVETVNGRAVVSYFAPDSGGPGSVTIQARLEDSIGQRVLRILEPATFFVASIEPNSGSPSGGETVVIRGGGFEEPVRVTFDGVPAQVQSVSRNRITVVTPPSTDPPPAGQTQPVTVAVTINLNEEEEATDALANAFVYARGGSVVQPQVFSVSPASGPNEGGTRVTITGEGFQAPVQVFFGEGGSATDFTGVEASVQSVAANRIVVLTPSATGFGQNNLNQVVDLLVKNVQSGFATVAPSAFQYGAGGADVPFISAISPGQGPITGGTLVTLFGQGFDEPVAVELAGVGQSIVSVTGTEVVVRTVPIEIDDCQDVEGESQLTNIETNETATGPSFRYRIPTSAQPQLFGVSPTSGPQGGGTLVTLSGQNFSEPMRVLIGGQSASVVSVESTEIRSRTPAFTGTFETEPCGNNGERFIPAPVDVEVINLSTGCTDVLQNVFSYVPNDTTCRNEDEEEPAECSDGFDNDLDGLIDADDPECTGPDDDDESA